MILHPHVCIVKGCSNNSTEGEFIGDLCVPCSTYLTTGNIGPTDSFLRDIRKEAFVVGWYNCADFLNSDWYEVKAPPFKTIRARCEEDWEYFINEI